VRGFISGSLLVAVTVAVVVNPAEVRGQQSSTAAQDAAAEARQAYDAGRKQEAIEAYKRAYELSGDHALLFRLGEVNREVGQDVAALRFYRSYVARDPRGKHRQAAERAVRELDLKLTKAAGGAPDAAPATPPAPAVPSGSSSPPSASPSLPAVDLSAAATPAPAPSGPPLPRWLPWAGLGATVALGAGAVVTGLGASHRYDELLGSCGQRAEGCPTSDIDDVKSRARTANLLWVAAGIGAAMTGVTFYVNTREAGFSGVWSF
jgi:tetratricopeptide (TPR) repeat protein